jgi:hypothetical protein
MNSIFILPEKDGLRPAPDVVRCDAQVYGTYDARARRWNMHRCSKHGALFDLGRWVCHAHRKNRPDGYVCGNRFDAFAKVMAIILGDEDAS